MLSAACKVERTPEKFFDQRDPIEVERQAAASEINDRLLAMGQALNRGSAAEARIALSPTLDIHVVGPAEGSVLSGAEQVDSLLSSLAEGATSAELRDVQIQVGPRANIAWFRAVLDFPGGDRKPLRVTGVYVRDAGLWTLVQAHLSVPFSPPSPPAEPSPAAPAADSAAAG